MQLQLVSSDLQYASSTFRANNAGQVLSFIAIPNIISVLFPFFNSSLYLENINS